MKCLERCSISNFIIHHIQFTHNKTLKELNNRSMINVHLLSVLNKFNAKAEKTHLRSNKIDKHLRS